jgi:predicted RNA-binding Zn-ribbon protein involved in translation (DUF1610 family)
MDPSQLVWLLILPAAVWVSLTFVFLSTSKIALKLRTAWNAQTKQELVDGSPAWALHSLLTFSAVLVGLFAWAQIQHSPPLTAILNPNHWANGLLDGTVLGLAMVGVAILLRTWFHEAQKFSLVTLAAVASPLPTRIGVLLVVVFTEEVWRAASLKSLVGAGATGPQALIAASIAYGVTYLAWGATATISEAIVGAVLGALYLWTGSFLVLFAAHLTLLTQLLLYTLVAGPDAEPRDMYSRRFTKCPACGAMLTRQQVNLDPDESFSCPRCTVRITVSDWRRGFFRWGYVFYTVGLWFASVSIVHAAALGEAVQFVLGYVLTCLSLAGFWSFLQVLFPKKLELETGDPHFLSLNLGKANAPPGQEQNSGAVDKPDSS